MGLHKRCDEEIRWLRQLVEQKDKRIQQLEDAIAETQPIPVVPFEPGTGSIYYHEEGADASEKE